MDSEPYLTTGIAQSVLPLLEPSAVPYSVGIDWGFPLGPSTSTGTYDTATGQFTDIRETPSTTLAPSCSDAVRRILRTTSEACARWFKVVRAALGRERDRQQKFRVEHGLPKSSRLPYQKPSVEPGECAAAEASETTLRCLYGDEVADYAKTKFLRAIETGDMRAFKIRLIVIKARDSLTGTYLLPDFIAGIEDCISTAEEIAGCTPDPSPRRLSRAEQERKRKLEAMIARKKEQQPELNLVWSTTPSSEVGKTGLKSGRDTGNASTQPCVQDIEHDKATHIIPASSSADVASAQSHQTLQNPISCKTSVDVKNDSQIKSKIKSNGANKNDQITPVTVTNSTNVTVTHKKRKRHSKLLRKTKDYATVEEILADVDAGLIAPYETAEEICADVQAGLLTETESILFTLALDRYNPLENAGVDSESALEMDRARVEQDDVEQDDEELGDGEDCAGEERSGRGPSISYNPSGFGGCGGRYTGSGMDWNPDDE